MTSLLMLLLLGTLVVLGVVVLGIRRPSGHLPPGMADELRRLREAVDDLTERIARVEDERDFDRRLLESIAKRELPPGEKEEGS
ncbi:MAG: hypothetical protein P8Z36_08625 [Gemmatimonadota bacterium]